MLNIIGYSVLILCFYQVLYDIMSKVKITWISSTELGGEKVRTRCFRARVRSRWKSNKHQGVLS
jgi:hypothetical protein